MKDMDYIFAVARIRVLEKTLLSDADISQMIALKDEQAVLAFLSDKGWGESGGSAPSAEEILACEEEKNRALMREMKIDPKVFDILSYPQLFHNLKAAIKEICTSETVPGIFYDLDRFGGKELMEILREKEFGRLPEYMRKAASDAYEVMLSTRDGQRCDIIVDRACLEAMRGSAKKLKEPMVGSYVESQVAVADIRVAVRSVRTGKSLGFLKEALADCDAFTASELAQAAAKGEEALYTFLENRGFAEAVSAMKDSPSAFERWCDNRLIETIRPQKRNSVSLGPVIAYYLARLNEIKTVRIILTAKANGFTEEETRERVREMYV